MTAENSKHPIRTKVYKHRKTLRADNAKKAMLNSGGVFEFITPDLATEYLKNNQCNRKLKESAIGRYARAMTKGKWRRTHQGIAFDTTGALIDGQHRLYAIIQAGVTVELMVTRGLSPEANDGLDDGVNRGMVDVLHYHGVQSTTLEVGLIRWMNFETWATSKNPLKRLTRDEKIELFLVHKESIAYTISLFTQYTPTPRMRLSAVMAVFARAYYTPKYRKRLAQAVSILVTGNSTGAEEDRWMVMLRNYLLYLKAIGGDIIRKEIYQKTERALYGYLTHEEIKGNLRPSLTELFPLPGEAQFIKEREKELETQVEMGAD